LPFSTIPLGFKDGEKIWQDGFFEGRESDARAEERNAQVRALRQEGQEPEAGDRDRTVGGSTRRRKGSCEKVQPVPFEAPISEAQGTVATFGPSPSSSDRFENGAAAPAAIVAAHALRSSRERVSHPTETEGQAKT
jgi:hypothetical protein